MVSQGGSLGEGTNPLGISLKKIIFWSYPPPPLTKYPILRQILAFDPYTTPLTPLIRGSLNPKCVIRDNLVLFSCLVRFSMDFCPL